MPPKGVIAMSHTSKDFMPARRFAVIGGDGRMTHLAEHLAEQGCSVSLLGCGHDCIPSPEEGPTDRRNLRVCSSLQKAAEESDILVLPLPATRDGQTVPCPRDPDCKVTFEELSAILTRRPDLLLFGGNLPSDFAEKHPSRAIDYYENQILKLQNAYITAEAALMTAMELTDCTLRGTSAAVLGYGRIGKYLARLLHTLGASVTVCARREDALFEAAAEGCRPLLLTESAPMNVLPITAI